MNIKSNFQGEIILLCRIIFIKYVKSLLYMLIKFKQLILKKLQLLMTCQRRKFKPATWQKLHFHSMHSCGQKSTICLSRLLYGQLCIFYGLCVNCMMKLVKQKSLHMRTLLGSHDSWSGGLCPHLHVAVHESTTLFEIWLQSTRKLEKRCWHTETTPQILIKLKSL